MVVEAERPGQQHGAAPHEGEVDQQRCGDADDVEGLVGDGVALEREEQDDGEQQPVERPGSDAGQQGGLVPLAALGTFAQGAGQEPRDERDAEEDEHGLGDAPHRDVEVGLVEKVVQFKLD